MDSTPQNFSSSTTVMPVAQTRTRLLVLNPEGDFDVAEKEVPVAPSSLNTEVSEATKTASVVPIESEQIISPSSTSAFAFTPPDSHFGNVNKAAFYFDMEDEKEATNTSLQTTSNVSPDIQFSLQKIAKRLVDDIVIDIVVPELRRRFLDALHSFFKEVRNENDIRDIISRPISKGGLGLDFEKTDQLINEAKLIKERVESKGGIVVSMDDEWLKTSPTSSPVSSEVPQSIQKTVSPVDITPKRETAVINLSETESPTNKISTSARIPTPGTMMPVSPVTTMTPTLQAVSSLQQKSPVFPTAVQTPMRKTIGDLGKKTIEDVKYIPPKVLGPLEEIQELSVPIFKKLARDTDDALRKIKDKLDLLAKESIKLYIDGVYAWRKGAVYRAYLEMGYTSLVEGKTLEVVAQDQIAKGAEGLSVSDFKKINKFNSTLKF